MPDTTVIESSPKFGEKHEPAEPREKQDTAPRATEGGEADPQPHYEVSLGNLSSEEHAEWMKTGKLPADFANRDKRPDEWSQMRTEKAPSGDELLAQLSPEEREKYKQSGRLPERFAQAEPESGKPAAEKSEAHPLREFFEGRAQITEATHRERVNSVAQRAQEETAKYGMPKVDGKHADAVLLDLAQRHGAKLAYLDQVFPHLKRGAWVWAEVVNNAGFRQKLLAADNRQAAMLLIDADERMMRESRQRERAKEALAVTRAPGPAHRVEGRSTFPTRDEADTALAGGDFRSYFRAENTRDRKLQHARRHAATR